MIKYSNIFNIDPGISVRVYNYLIERGGTRLHIGELSKKTGISVRALRYYEQKNLIHSERMENSYRIFDEQNKLI